MAVICGPALPFQAEFCLCITLKLKPTASPAAAESTGPLDRGPFPHIHAIPITATQACAAEPKATCPFAIGVCILTHTG